MNDIRWVFLPSAGRWRAKSEKTAMAMANFNRAQAHEWASSSSSSAMAESPPVHPLVQPIAFLLGTWRGEGEGGFPTIQSFKYGEEIKLWHTGKVCSTSSPHKKKAIHHLLLLYHLSVLIESLGFLCCLIRGKHTFNHIHLTQTLSHGPTDCLPSVIYLPHSEFVAWSNRESTIFSDDVENVLKMEITLR